MARNQPKIERFWKREKKEISTDWKLSQRHHGPLVLLPVPVSHHEVSAGEDCPKN